MRYDWRADDTVDDEDDEGMGMKMESERPVVVIVVGVVSGFRRRPEDACRARMLRRFTGEPGGYSQSTINGTERFDTGRDL